MCFTDHLHYGCACLYTTRHIPCGDSACARVRPRDFYLADEQDCVHCLARWVRSMGWSGTGYPAGHIYAGEERPDARAGVGVVAWQVLYAALVTGWAVGLAARGAGWGG